MRTIAQRMLFAVFLLTICLDVRGQAVGSAVPPSTQHEEGLPPGYKPQPELKGSVAGHVTLADLRGPARGARVMLMSADEGKAGRTGSQMALTGLDGNFLIEHVAPGEYFVLAVAAGYLSALDGIQMSGQNGAGPEAMKEVRKNAPVTRVISGERARVEVELRRGAVLSGRVTYADGLPAAQLRVRVERADLVPRADGTVAIDAGVFLREFALAQRDGTDDEGRFRIAGLAPGVYRVAIPQRSGRNQEFADEQISDTAGLLGPSGQLTYYSGNTLHPKAAKTYKLSAGETVDGVDIALPLSGLHAVSGVLSSKDGEPINYASVTLEDTADPAISFRAALELDGGFRFSNVPEGTYTLKVTSAGFIANPAAAEVPPEMIDQIEPYKRTRAYADQTIPVLVGTTDVDNLALTMVETKVPANKLQPQPPAPIPAAEPQ